LASILKTDPDWQRLPTEAGADIRQIIYKCLQKDPAQRYQSAGALWEDLRKSREVLTASPPKPIDLKALLKLLKRPKAEIVVALFLLIICLTTYGIIRHIKNHRWAIGSIPDIIKMIESDQYLAAFQLAKKVEKYIPGNEMLDKLWPEMSRELPIITTPPGADILYKEYSDTDGQWLYFGQSPQEIIKFPLGFYRCKFAKEGFETRETFVSNRIPERMLEIELQKTGSNPGMVLVKMTPSLFISEPEIDYLIDKYEVTNEQFKKFIDTGGYTKQEYWKNKFVKNGRELSLEQARETFKDTTGRPGPSTWAGGTYPSGQDDYPVSGISWYEAAAYAEFAGKDLPPKDCWWYAAGDWQMFSGGESLTNFGDGPAPVGSYQGVGIHGLYDMAGNVREWCWNATDDSGNQRYIRGGSWEDPGYMFAMEDVRSPWDRDRGNGFRCVRYIRGKDSIPDSYFEPNEPQTIRDYTSITPLSEKEFQVFQEFCRYDRTTELDPNVEWYDDSPRHWCKEKITFNAAYGGERIIAYLFLPKGVKKPYQPVITFPHIGCFWEDFGDIHVHDFVIKTGRAVLYPFYKGTYERRFDGGAPWKEPYAYRDWHVQMVKDLSRSIDYLETRKDINIEKLTFYGQSWGAMEGLLMLSMEDRIKLGVFDDGGFPSRGIPKEVLDIARFADHVDVPVLMFNGKSDSIFLYKTHQLPLYEILKANNEKTIHRLYSGPHGIFGFHRTEIARDVREWLDEHLGPVDFESQKP
jgi:dienelactone hydrolase